MMSAPCAVSDMTMSERRELQPAYVLHSRPYRDTSVILDLLSRSEGRFSAVVKGARSEKSKYRGRLQPFTPMLVAAVGKGELKTATSMEFPGRPYQLSGENLFLGLYINELMYRLLGKFDPMQELFDGYDELLAHLQADADSVVAVRAFELNLLRDLGYGISFEYDAADGEFVESDRYYEYVVHEGFRQTRQQDPLVYPGTELLHLASGEYDKVNERRLRYLTRTSLARLLGDKPLKSRSLFVSAAREQTQESGSL